MTTAFQSNAFQNNAFQIDAVVPPAASTTNVIGAGAGYGKRRGGLQGRVRLLSELDEKPLFTPEEVLAAEPSYNVDDETRAAIEAQVLAAFGEIADKTARIEMQRRQYAELMERERQLNDDDETFLVM